MASDGVLSSFYEQRWVIIKEYNRRLGERRESKEEVPKSVAPERDDPLVKWYNDSVENLRAKLGVNWDDFEKWKERTNNECDLEDTDDEDIGSEG